MSKGSGGTRATNSRNAHGSNNIPSAISSFGGNERDKQSLVDAYRKVFKMSDAEKAELRFDDLSRAYEYLAEGRTSTRKKELLDKLSSKGTEISRTEITSTNTGIGGVYSFRNGAEYIQVSGLHITTGMKKFRENNQRLGRPGEKRWVGGGKFLRKTDKTEIFSIYDTAKVSALLKRLKIQ